MKNSVRPIVLCFSGHDPVGGAGMQADAETLHALGVHACSAITALTVQDSRGVHGFEPVTAKLFRQQARAVLDDMPVAAIKIGMTGSIAIIEAIHDLLDHCNDRQPAIPVILDPVLAGGGGGALAHAGLIDALRGLLPRISLLTPNTPELLQLAGCENREQAVQRLQQFGAHNLLITGGHDTQESKQESKSKGSDPFDFDASGQPLDSRLRGNDENNNQKGQAPLIHNHLHIGADHYHWQWPRLPGEFHGSGCTLASACAAFIAHGHELADACERAQRYTFDALSRAIRPGQGQQLPWR